MAALLKDLVVNSVDLCGQGANQDAYIRLFKSKESIKKDAQTFANEVGDFNKRKICDEIWDYTNVFSNSLVSIIRDENTDAQTKPVLMNQSLVEFNTFMKIAIENWIKGGTVQKKKESKDMKIDKSKMTPEELGVIAELEKKYGLLDEPATGDSSNFDVRRGESVDGLHPEVMKALDEAELVRKAQAAEIELLKKTIEMDRLITFAKKYELIGRKPDELAPKLYDLKKAGGTIYNDYVALLEDNLALVKKSRLFGEIGKNTSGSLNAGDEINANAADIRKNSNISTYEAITKAFEDNPELAMQYDNEYFGRA